MTMTTSTTPPRLATSHADDRLRSALGVLFLLVRIGYTLAMVLAFAAAIGVVAGLGLAVTIGYLVDMV